MQKWRLQLRVSADNSSGRSCRAAAQGKALWRAQHGALFAQFSRGTHRYLDTGHNLHHEDPAAVVDAIRDVAATRLAAD
ncbi:hypothetical protein [Luteimonas sp. YGD11-2]|uniref:hypothetical protein n=1 Tax=Luteimonas sp. YGD11-2 TaxID=2508168 RepID=UPI00100C000F